MLYNVLATVIFFICLLSYILIFSLMQTDVEERKYEFAVLRTCGFRNNSLVSLIAIQTAFFAVPGIVIGYFLLYFLVFVTQKIICDVTRLQIVVLISNRTVFLGFIVGTIIPAISNILPVKDALSSQLRAALDKFRPSIDDVEVQMVRKEN